MTEMMHQRVNVVVPAELMDDETFTKHMNLRHGDSIGGLHSLWLISPSVTGAWRAFHDRLHSPGIRHSHTHEEL